jgi:hypothetical protein
VSYTKTADLVQGLLDTTTTEQTSARLWDIPVMLRYRGLGERGIRSKMYVSGGGAFSKVSHIRTNNDTTNPDGTTSSDTTPVEPSARNVAGLVAGVGLRLVDDFHIKVTPELRYTRWLGAIFDSDSTRMSKNQLAIGLGFTF